MKHDSITVGGKPLLMVAMHLIITPYKVK